MKVFHGKKKFHRVPNQSSAEKNLHLIQSFVSIIGSKTLIFLKRIKNTSLIRLFQPISLIIRLNCYFIPLNYSYESLFEFLEKKTYVGSNSKVLNQTINLLPIQIILSQESSASRNFLDTSASIRFISPQDTNTFFRGLLELFVVCMKTGWNQLVTFAEIVTCFKTMTFRIQ